MRLVIRGFEGSGNTLCRKIIDCLLEESTKKGQRIHEKVRDDRSPNSATTEINTLPENEQPLLIAQTETCKALHVEALSQVGTSYPLTKRQTN